MQDSIYHITLNTHLFCDLHKNVKISQLEKDIFMYVNA